MKKAFTLIELLVVIAIIAILAAILFPVFAQAKQAAKKTSDLSNVKNIGTASMLYLGDADDVYPLSQYPGPTFAATGETVSWQRAIMPYIKNGDSQKNAAGETVGKGAGGIFTGPGFPKANQANGSYAMHNGVAPEGVFPWSGAGYTVKTVSATSISAPADKILLVHRGASATKSTTVDYGWPTFLADEWNWVDWMGMSDENGTPTNGNIQHYTVIKDGSGNVKGDCDDMRTGMDPAWDFCGQYPRYRFSGSTNVAFMDGHAKGMRRADKSTTINYAKNIFLQGISNGGNGLY